MYNSKFYFVILPNRLRAHITYSLITFWNFMITIQYYFLVSTILHIILTSKLNLTKKLEILL